MTLTDTTAPSQTESISFEFDLPHAPEKVWRALTDPVLLAEWLLPVVGLELEPGAAFTFKTQPYPGWDGTVNCRFLEIEAHRKLSYTWVVGDMRHRRDVHAHAHGVGHAPVPRAVGLQAGPEAELRRRALRLEDDGREARRPAREDPMSTMDSADPPLAVHRLHADRHRQLRRAGMRQGQPPPWVTYSPLLPLACSCSPAVHVRAAVCHQWRSEADAPERSAAQDSAGVQLISRNRRARRLARRDAAPDRAALIKEADPASIEERKWEAHPVWSHDGIVCTGETYKNAVKMTVRQGRLAGRIRRASSTRASMAARRRAIDIPRGREDRCAGPEGAPPRAGCAERLARAAADRREQSHPTQVTRTWPPPASTPPTATT